MTDAKKNNGPVWVVILVVVFFAQVIFFAVRVCERNRRESYRQAVLDTVQGRVIAVRVWKKGWRWEVRTNKRALSGR